MAVIAASHGQNVWLSSVKESFGSSAGPAEHPMTQYSASAPPQRQVAHPTGTTADLTLPVAPSPAVITV